MAMMTSPSGADQVTDLFLNENIPPSDLSVAHLFLINLKFPRLPWLVNSYGQIESSQNHRTRADGDAKLLPQYRKGVPHLSR